MGGKPKEIKSISLYKCDISEFRSIFGNRIDHLESMVRITYTDSTEHSESAQTLVMCALYWATEKGDDSLLLKVIEFGVVELLSNPELRRKYLSYVKNEHVSKGKRSAKGAEEKSKNIHETIKKYLEEGDKLSGNGCDESTAFGKAAADHFISISTARDHYYHVEEKLKYDAELNNAPKDLLFMSKGGNVNLQSDEKKDLEIKRLIDSANKKRLKPNFDNVIQKVSQKMMITEEECLMRYKRGEKQ